LENSVWGLIPDGYGGRRALLVTWSDGLVCEVDLAPLEGEGRHGESFELHLPMVTGVGLGFFLLEPISISSLFFFMEADRVLGQVCQAHEYDKKCLEPKCIAK
jgi:hypothetical protein